MFRKLLLIVLDVIAFATFLLIKNTEAQTPPLSISGKFYKFDEVAQVGQDNLSGIYQPTINDSGTIAFIGHTTGSFIHQIFARNVNGQLRAITAASLPGVVERVIGDIQINNSNQVVSFIPRDPAGEKVVRLWDGNALESSTLVANSVFNGDFLNIGNQVSVNNSPDNPLPLFLAQNNALPLDHLLVTGIRPNFNSRIDNNLILAQGDDDDDPRIADNGNVIYKASGPSSSPIRLLTNNLTSPIDIATIGPTQFSDLGRKPGITDDGQIVAFYGNMAAGIDAGPGIFLSIPQGSGRILKKVTGKKYEMAPLPGQTWPNLNGNCEAGEPCSGELGLDSSNNPLYLNSFVSDSRIGIIHQSLDAAGLDGDILVLCFLATPNSADNNPTGYFSNQLGIWTQRISLRSVGGVINTLPSRPTPVVQEGDNLNGVQIALGELNDPIAKVMMDSQGLARSEKPGDHQVVFAVVGSIVYRATQTDTDEDGLYDHWETSGIDFNHDGNIDLPLHQPCPTNSPGHASCGANPNSKDLFVEIDYMQSPQWSHRPDYKPNGDVSSVSALDQVRRAFANAPVSNPTGSNGIALHSGADEALTESETITIAGRRPGATDDFYDYKFGNTANICTDGHFGTLAERSNADSNCINRLKAKALVFRYTIFANSFIDNTPPRPGNTTPQYQETVELPNDGETTFL